MAGAELQVESWRVRVYSVASGKGEVSGRFWGSHVRGMGDCVAETEAMR